MQNADLIQTFRTIVGRRHVLTGARATERYRKGFRSGEGDAIAVVVPGTLIEMWNVLKACVAADKILILQAANTGLTEGSTPKGTYDREVVILSTLRMDKIHLLRDGVQFVSLSGGTLFQLEKMLKPLGLEPHSVIGSSCIGASVLGGVCNNSGGSLVRRGPVYTELACYAEISEEGELRLVNHLGIDLGETPEEILGRLDRGDFASDAVRSDTGVASQDGYADKVVDVEADSPARYNADPEGLYEASGCAGKLAVFAVRLDSFPTEMDQKVYYIGTNSVDAMTELRRKLLQDLPELPISGEYLHRECFDIARTYGKDTVLMIHWFGTDWLPRIFALKGAMEAILNETVGPSGWFLCDAHEGKIAGLHRFAAAGAAIRMQAVRPHEIEDTIALDIALKRNDRAWFETLPEDISRDLMAKLYYGHFLCHVFHQDYAVRKGVDTKALKARMLALLDQRGAEYPAEHNVGHLYTAKPALAAHYQSLDPTNSFNPGIGKTSREKHYGQPCDCGAAHETAAE
ncbi:MAG: D-lactate dehydrogenase [Pseudomonadota bacterium]